MHARDEVRWSEQTMELRQTEPGQKFLQFLEFWFSTADGLLDAERLDSPTRLTAAAAMRRALPIAEGQFGMLTMDWIGQMVCVAVQHWVHGEVLAAELTYIEHRAMEEALARKIQELQASAANLPVEDSHVNSTPLGDSDG
jgi:hypothetical protein